MRNTKITYHTIDTLLARTREEGDCHIWTGFMQNGTVPSVSHGDKMTPVRKLIFGLLGKSTASKGFYSTRCGTTSCVSPDHIIKRQPKEHAAYMAKKLFANPAALAIRSAKLSKSKQKITDEQAVEIIRSKESHAELSRRIGVSINTIKKRRSGQVGATLRHNPWLQMLRLGGMK